MSEPELIPVATADPVVPSSAGALLRQARETQGIHLDSLAVSLKVPVHKLEALEADRHDMLLDSVFVRALAASVCRALKIDPMPIMERLPASASPNLRTDEAGINAPFRLTGNGVAGSLALGDPRSRLFVGAMVALLVGILVLALFPFEKASEGAKTAQPAVGRELPAPSAPVAAPGPLAATDTAAPAQLSSLALASSDAPLAIKPAAQAAAAASAAAMPSSTVLLFQAQAASWVEVVDAARVVRVRKILSAGEVLAASGELPLAVVVGSADALQVQVRGKVLDLKPLAKNNVARFEVK